MGVFDSIAGAATGLPVVSTALSAAGPVLGYMGTQDTNDANRDIASARNLMEVEEAKKARDFSASQSEINRSFQAEQIKQKLGFDERMSSTAVQRRMEDLRKAGINPILAGKYDASTPAAAAAAGNVGATSKANAHAYTAQNKIQAALDNISTVLDLKTKIAQIENIQASTGKTGAEIQSITHSLPKKSISSSIWSPIAQDLLDFKEWAMSIQSNAKQGKYMNQLNELLDKGDEFVYKKYNDYWKGKSYRKDNPTIKVMKP